MRIRTLLFLILLAAGVIAGCSPAAETAAPANPTPTVEVLEDVASAPLPARVTPQEAMSRLESDPNAVLLDVRELSEWQRDGRSESATLIPLGELEGRALAELNPDDTILVICRSGNRSQVGAATLRNLGFSNVSDIEGGMRNWVAQGGDLVCDVATCGLAQ